MKKLLLLAVIGLALGGGVWISQNPQGTAEDFKNQAFASVERLKTGVDAGISAVREQPVTIDTQAARQEELSQRLTSLEQTLQQNDSAGDQRLAELVDSQVSSTRSEVQTLQTSTAALESTVDSLQRSLGDLESKVNDNVSSSLASLETDMTESVASIESKLASTSAGTDAGIVRLDAIDKRLELLVRRLDEQTVETELQSLTDVVEGVGTELEELKSESRTQQARLAIDLARINEKADTLGLRVDTFAGSLSGDSNAENTDNPASAGNLALSSGVDDRLSALEQKLADVNTGALRIRSLEEQLDAANSKIAELESQDEEAQRTLSRLNRSLSELKTAGESLSIDTVQAEIREQLATAQAQIESEEQSTDTDELVSLLEKTRNRIQTLEQRVQDLPASSTEADTALQIQSELQSQIAALQRRVEDVSTTDPALENTVQDVKEQVEQLSSRQESKSIEYKIYFDRNSAEITDDAANVLNSFIAQEQNRTTGVSIFGFTDRSGSAAYNQQLALQRATNVRSYLIQNGLDFTKIKALSGLGEDAAAVVLPDESADAQQRVVVLYADQP
jgi:outer membrane protein OmpA-like peptidoglycan-associated protein